VLSRDDSRQLDVVLSYSKCSILNSSKRPSWLNSPPGAPIASAELKTVRVTFGACVLDVRIMSGCVDCSGRVPTQQSLCDAWVRASA
jgi:hypothetical protein